MNIKLGSRQYLACCLGCSLRYSQIWLRERAAGRAGGRGKYDDRKQKKRKYNGNPRRVTRVLDLLLQPKQHLTRPGQYPHSSTQELFLPISTGTWLPSPIRCCRIEPADLSFMVTSAKVAFYALFMTCSVNAHIILFCSKYDEVRVQCYNGLFQSRKIKLYSRTWTFMNKYIETEIQS